MHHCRLFLLVDTCCFGILTFLLFILFTSPPPPPPSRLLPPFLPRRFNNFVVNGKQGHRLRGAHHAYFWLLIWQDALTELSSLLSHRSIEAVHKDINHHIANSHVKMGAEQQMKTPFVDDMNCYTDYEPHSMSNISLKALVLTPLGVQGDANDHSKN